MTTFDDREKGFENKFAYDEEIAFKINARRNKLLGLWAASQLGKQGEEAEQYANDIVMTEFENERDHDIVGKLLKDFTHSGVMVTAKQIQFEMEQLLSVARMQVMGN